MNKEEKYIRDRELLCWYMKNTKKYKKPIYRKQACTLDGVVDLLKGNFNHVATTSFINPSNLDFKKNEVSGILMYYMQLVYESKEIGGQVVNLEDTLYKIHGVSEDANVNCLILTSLVYSYLGLSQLMESLLDRQVVPDNGEKIKIDEETLNNIDRGDRISFYKDQKFKHKAIILNVDKNKKEIELFEIDRGIKASVNIYTLPELKEKGYDEYNISLEIKGMLERRKELTGEEFDIDEMEEFIKGIQ